MAGAAMVLGSAAVNALAFSGSNYLFSKLDSKEESKRHNLAMEKLQQDQAEYEKNRLMQLDFVNTRLKEEGHADKTFEDVDEALHQYYLFTGTTLPSLKKPVLSDYYTPNIAPTMSETGELILIVFGITVVYYLVKQKYKSK